MKGKRFTEEQIIAVLREHEAGAKAGEMARKNGISEATLYSWKAKYGDRSGTAKPHRLIVARRPHRWIPSSRLFCKRAKREG